jgi:signal transduction histidine kinase
LHAPSELKHIWIFTYPIVLLYFTDKHGFYWVSAFVTTMFILNFQPFIPTYYTLFQISYLALDLIVISIIIQLYRNKIDEYEETIRIQNHELENFSHLLQGQVDQKTKELLLMNQNLESQVEQKVNELLKKDRIILSQSRHAAMGEMISMIAHQWRQPLSNITLQISNLQINSMLREVEPSEILTKLETISDTIVYLSETIDDFQSFFQPNKAKESIDICKLIKRAVSFCMPKALANSIEIEFTCKDEIILNTHPNELVQVLINLINNAIDATLLNHPQVCVITIDVEYCDNDEYLLVIVKDHGGGIPEEIKERIFEPYFSTKGKNGTGIGLYMSKMIIESHIEGKIDFVNQNEGAAFKVQIPLV